MFKIIKDCSPYCILFTYDGLKEYIKSLQDIANRSQFTISNNKRVTEVRQKFPNYLTEEFYVKDNKDLELIIEKNPCSALLSLDKSAAFLTTFPGVKSPIHIDINDAIGIPVKFRVNYPIYINDDKCITRWYNSFDDKTYIIDNSAGELECVKSLNFSQDYAILFNTSIHHEWDNSLSDNKRTIVGMRADNNHTDITFEQAKTILFEI
jgi:hypothetical protein